MLTVSTYFQPPPLPQLEDHIEFFNPPSLPPKNKQAQANTATSATYKVPLSRQLKKLSTKTLLRHEKYYMEKICEGVKGISKTENIPVKFPQSLRTNQLHSQKSPRQESKKKIFLFK